MVDDASLLRGHLILRSHAPLPRFSCAIPVPPPESLVLQLRNTVVAILTGQVSTSSASTGDKPDKARPSSGAPAGAAAAAAIATERATGTSSKEVGLSYSEHLKQQIVHDWRLKSIVLELNQNALIAPETRSAIDEERDSGSEEREKGFVLLDEHECALLEHGDEVNVWLKDGQDVDTLRLPKLPSRHVFGLPNQPKLARSGTILSLPPAYSEIDHDQFHLSLPETAIRKPNEPSSHSSSVSAHPDGQFETRARHQMPANGWHRVVTVPAAQQTESNGQTGAQQPALWPSTTRNEARRAKPKRLMSAGSNAVLEQGPPKPTAPIRQNSASSPLMQSTTRDSRANSFGITPTPPLSPLPVSSPTLASNKELVNLQASSSAPVPSKAERAEREKVRKAGQRAMPSQALVIGPGVQGKVGRMSSFDSSGRNSDEQLQDANGTSTIGAAEKTGRSNSHSEYGNKDAFVSFTAASSEVHQLRQQNSGHTNGARRMSNRSATSDKQSGALLMTSSRPGDDKSTPPSRGVIRVSSGGGGDKKDGTDATAGPSSKGSGGKAKASSAPKYVTLPDKPEIPAIRNLAPFSDEDAEVGQGLLPQRETLLSMPMPKIVSELVPSTPSSSSTPRSPDAPIPSDHSMMSQRELQMANDAAIAQALSESLALTPEPLLLTKSDLASTSGTTTVTATEARPSARHHVSLNDVRPLPSTSPALHPPTRRRQTSEQVVRTSGTTAAAISPRSPGTASSSPVLTRQSSDSLSRHLQRQEAASPTPPSASPTLANAPAAMSKADRRYNEVRRALEAEKERQALQEQQRKEKARKATEEKAKASAKQDHERRQREEKKKWQLWDEVRIRQTKEQAR